MTSSITRLSLKKLPTYLQSRLAECYPAGIPAFAQNRLSEELLCMENAHAEESMLLCHALSQASTLSGHVLHVDGSSVGSFLVFLLMQSRINPLPAHYYCLSCGYYELAENVTFGLDLPEKSCPHCGVLMRRDGFSIPVETVWQINSKKRFPLEYRCSEGFFPYGFQVIKEFYAEKNHVVTVCGAIQADNTRLLEPVGVIILPEGRKAEDYPQFHAYLADGTPCFAADGYELKKCKMQRIILAVNNVTTALQRTQAQNGVFHSSVSTESLIGVSSREITNTAFVSSEECIALQLPNPSYYDIACALTLPHNTYVTHAEDSPVESVLRLKEFIACPLYCREDVFDLMVADGFDRERAARATKVISSGRVAYKLRSLEKLDVSDELSAMAAHCAYLFPRGSGAQRLVSLMLLAKTMKEDPQGYFRAIAPICQEK